MNKNKKQAKRTERLGFRLTEKQAEKLRRSARVGNKSISDFVVELLALSRSI